MPNWTPDELAAAGYVINPSDGKPRRIAPHTSTTPPVASPGAECGKVPRRASKARTFPTEHEEQVYVINAARAHEDQYLALKMLVAIPNGGLRNVIVAKKLKAEGVVAGYPDLLLDYPVPPYHGLRIEMKITKGGVVSPAQSQWLKDLRQQGYAAVVCRGGQAAFENILRYLEGREPLIDEEFTK